MLISVIVSLPGLCKFVLTWKNGFPFHVSFRNVWYYIDTFLMYICKCYFSFEMLNRPQSILYVILQKGNVGPAILRILDL